MTDYQKSLLKKLGYDPTWLEYGLIDEDLLRLQSKQYDISADKNIEHYRYAAFRAFLEKNTVLDDTLLDIYVRLAQLDEDPVMAQSALILLIGWPHLTDSQLDRLSKHPAFVSPTTQRHIERTGLLRLLRASAVTDELFDRCIISHDEVVQRELLKRHDISHQQLEVFQVRGANKAIRNIAKQKQRGHC